MNGRSPHGDGLCAKHDAVSVQCDSDVWEGGRGGDKRKTGVAVWMVLAEWVGYRNRRTRGCSEFFLGFFHTRAIRIRTYHRLLLSTLYPLPFALYGAQESNAQKRAWPYRTPNQPNLENPSLRFVLYCRRRSWQRARCRRLCQRALSGPSIAIAIARGSRRWRRMIVSSGTIMTGESPNRTKKTLLSASFPVPNRIQRNVPTTTSSLPGSSSPCWGSA